MRDGVGFFPSCDSDLPFGDKRASDRGAEQVHALIDGVRPEHGKNEIPNELLFQILDINLAGARVEGFFLNLPEVLGLTDVGDKGDHFCLVVVD